MYFQQPVTNTTVYYKIRMVPVLTTQYLFINMT